MMECPASRGSRIIVRVGRQRYAIDLSCAATALAGETDPAAERPLRVLQVETKFLRLRRPAMLGDRIDLSKEFLKCFCDVGSRTMRIDEHANINRKTADSLRRKVFPKMLPGPYGESYSLCNLIVDLGADCNQRIAVACAIIHTRRVIRVEVCSVHVAAIIRRLAEGTDGKSFANACNPILEAKPHRAITEIGFGPIARGVSTYTRYPSKTVQAQPLQIPLQDNSGTERDAVSSSQHSHFDGWQFRFRRFHGGTVHASNRQKCSKS